MINVLEEVSLAVIIYIQYTVSAPKLGVWLYSTCVHLLVFIEWLHNKYYQVFDLDFDLNDRSFRVYHCCVSGGLDKV